MQPDLRSFSLLKWRGHGTLHHKTESIPRRTCKDVRSHQVDIEDCKLLAASLRTGSMQCLTYAMTSTENPALIKPSHTNKKSSELGQIRPTHFCSSIILFSTTKCVNDLATTMEPLFKPLNALGRQHQHLTIPLLMDSELTIEVVAPSLIVFRSREREANSGFISVDLSLNINELGDCLKVTRNIPHQLCCFSQGACEVVQTCFGRHSESLES
jgi:hypothetical protein